MPTAGTGSQLQTTFRQPRPARWLHGSPRFPQSRAPVRLHARPNCDSSLSCAVPSCHAQDKAIPAAPNQDAKAPQSQRSATQPAYAVAQLLPVAVQPGVTIPAAYVEGMEVRIAHALEESKRFTQVNQASNIPAAQSASTLRIGCTVIKFAPGNRVVRTYIPGAGATKITVHVVFNDSQSGKVLLEQNVKGLVWYGGAINGFDNPNSAQNDIAKDIENIVKKHF